MRYFKNVLFIVFVFSIASCKKEALEKTKEENFEVEFLFEKDGCKVYRFYDGRYIYYSDCRGKIDYSYTQNNGKSSTTKHVQTLNN